MIKEKTETKEQQEIEIFLDSLNSYIIHLEMQQ